jgi:hypothetical protein
MSAHKYHATCHEIAMWKEHELAHIGRIASMKDKDLQYSYALSTVNGLVHLRDAIYEKVVDPKHKEHRDLLQEEHDDVVRATQHLIKDYGINLATIRAFNERHVLRDMSYLKPKKVRHVKFAKTMRKKNKKN